MKKILIALLFLLFPALAFSSGINYCDGVAVTTDTAFCGVSGGMSHACGVAVKSSGWVEPLFYANWTTNSPAIDDELCSVCGGCPDTWDYVNHSTTTAVVSGELVTTYSTSTGTYIKSDSEGMVLYGTNHTEYWIEISFSISRVADYSANQTKYIIDNADYVQTYRAASATINTDSSGVLNGYRVQGRKDGGVYYYGSTISWSPVSDTYYIARFYFKKATALGANDGIVWLKIDDGDPSIVTNADNDTFTGLSQSNIMNGALGGAVVETTNTQYYKLYVTDPGW